MSDEVTDEAIVEYAIGWVPQTGAIDWDDLLYRIESAFDIDLPEAMLDPRIVQLKVLIRKARKERNA